MKRALFVWLAIFHCLCGYGFVTADEPKPEYNIWITNSTDSDIHNVEVVYGAEIFKIKLIESQTFKWRSFVNYEVPKNVTFKWEDEQGEYHEKGSKIPSYKLDRDHIANLFLTIKNNEELFIEWKST